jgi:hypothetical protein
MKKREREGGEASKESLRGGWREARMRMELGGKAGKQGQGKQQGGQRSKGLLMKALC